MSDSRVDLPIRLAASDCLTGHGDADATLAALLRGESALKLRPVLGHAGGDLVPLALHRDRALDESLPPVWLAPSLDLLQRLPSGDWGRPRRPVVVTSSNFGVGSMHAFRLQGDTAHLAHGTPGGAVRHLAAAAGWGDDITTFSHACVSAHLGLLHATRLLHAGLADAVLVFSFDFLSPFVAGGFHALKILNGSLPAPYADRETGAIGLGDGAAWAVLTRDSGEHLIAAQSLHNEMFHFTNNAPDGSGFTACLQNMDTASRGRRLWLKGHGTGTLDAGRLEVDAFARRWPDQPLVSWKGGLGHTLGSCGLVELALAVRALATGRAPGTIGTTAPTLGPAVATTAFDLAGYDGVILASNAFGGAHAACLLSHA